MAGEILRIWPFPLIFGDSGNNSLVIDSATQIPTKDALTGENLEFAGTGDERSPFAPFVPTPPNGILIPSFPGETDDTDEPFGPEPPPASAPPPLTLPEPITGKINQNFPVMKAKLFDGQDMVDASKLGAPIIARGGNGEDTLIGSQFGDKLFGNGHNDTIKGLGGDDIIEGGNGQDTIEGGEGNDCIDGGDAKDTIEGNGGNDLVMGGGGDDTIDLGSGNDAVESGAGNDTIKLGTGIDTVFVTKDDLGTVDKSFTDTIVDFSVDIKVESTGGRGNRDLKIVNNGDNIDLRRLGKTFVTIDEILGDVGADISVYLNELDFNRGEVAYNLELKGVDFAEFESGSKLTFEDLVMVADGTRLRIGIDELGDGDTVQ